MTVGEKIRKIRKAKKISQRELGERLGGISQQQIGQWENGDKNPKIETIQKIADALEVNYTELFNWEDIPEIRHCVYSFDLDAIKDFISRPYFIYTEEAQNSLIQNIDRDISEGSKIHKPDERYAFFNNLQVKYSHELLSHTLSLLDDKDVLFLADLIAKYISLNNDAQSKILDYVDDLFEIPRYMDKDSE